ncbi:AMP-binding protein [Antrihabitans stalactiti]|uniref:AMP-binding protein n=1 Tax=Antrihabitans stalactiti TaxID=2584121 RepID=A0A848KJU4_9NOCA|nr:AMP-binding protein [Antrihabitans stalactiti]NMN98106.1 AMP-binding protein [Antrihabitans stalactiti]
MPNPPTSRLAPDGVAAATADCTLTNIDLYRWSNRLTRVLADHGVVSGSRVAIVLDHSIESMVASVAVAKIGAREIAVDPRTPRANWNRALAATTVGVTTRAHRERLSDAVCWLVLDDRATVIRYKTVSDESVAEFELRRSTPISA